MATVILKTNPPRLGLALLRSNRNYPRQFRLIARTMSTERDQVIERARKLHTLNDPMQVKEYYKEWAKDYDKDKAMMGVKNDEFIQVFLTLDVPKEARILDIGCGTGENGLLLRDAGYTNVDGLDFSQEMLDVARGKGCYKKLINAMVAKEVVLPIEPKTYDLVVSSGSFCPGHMKWDSFGQIARVVKTGGIIYWNTPEHGHDHGHSHGHDHHHGHSHGETCDKGRDHHHANQTVDASQNHGHSGHHGDNKHFVDGFVQQKLWEYLPGYPMRKMVHIGDNTAKVTFYAMKVL